MKFSFTIALLFCSVFAFASDGLVIKPSQYGFTETVDRALSTFDKKGITVFKHLKHSEGAAKVGIDIPNTHVIIFGNPKVGSPLMACEQKVAIDLPQKLLIWEDSNAMVRIAYNDPIYLKDKHVVEDCDAEFEKVGQILHKLSASIAGTQN